MRIILSDTYVLVIMRIILSSTSVLVENLLLMRLILNKKWVEIPIDIWRKIDQNGSSVKTPIIGHEMQACSASPSQVLRTTGGKKGPERVLLF